MNKPLEFPLALYHPKSKKICDISFKEMCDIHEVMETEWIEPWELSEVVIELYDSYFAVVHRPNGKDS